MLNMTKKTSATAIAAWVVKTRSVIRYSTPVNARAMATVPAIASRFPLRTITSLSPSRKRDRRAQERGVVDVALGRVQFPELAGKADGEEEAEQDLGAWDEGAQLLEQLAVFPLQPLLDLFVVGIFPEPLLDRFVGGHDVLPPGFRPAICAAHPGSALLTWDGSSVASAPEEPSRIVWMINGILDPMRGRARS